MAQKTIVTLTDDIDGSPATRTLTFSYDGKNYEIDLNDEHAAKFETAIEPYIAARRRVATLGASVRRSSRRPAGDGPSPTELRDWAKANGHTVSERGRISAEVRAAYAAAH